MNNFYILYHERPEPKLHAYLECILLGRGNLPIPNPFNEGNLVAPDNFTLKVQLDRSEIGTLGDKLSLTILNNETLLVVSSKLKALLDKLGDNLQFYQTKVIMGEREYLNYFIVNILQVVDAIDYKKSKLIYSDTTYSEVFHIDDLVLIEDKIPSHFNIFLLGNVKGRAVILISNNLKEELERSDISGVNLYRPEDFVI